MLKKVKWSSVAKYFKVIQLFFLLFSFAFSAHPYKPVIENPLLEEWRWINLPELNGKGIRCFIDDQDNAMWFGIDNGIMYYNGYDWIEYDHRNGFTDKSVTAICTAEDGSLYAGSDSGVFVFKENYWRLICPEPANSKMAITSIIGLPDQSILCGTNIGLLWISGEKKTFYTSKMKDIDNFKNLGYDLQIIADTLTVEDIFYISDILVDRSGKIWLAVGYQDGLSGKIVHIYPSSDSTGGLIFSTYYIENPENRYFNGAKFLEAADGDIWFITNQQDQGHIIFTKDSLQYFSLFQMFGEDDIANSIIQTRDGTIWIGGWGKLYSFSNGNWKIIRATEIPIRSSKRVLLYEARDGILWIAGKQNEVFRLDYTFDSWATYKGLNFEGETSDGTLWFLTVNGRAVCMKDNKWQVYDIEDGLINSPVRIFVTSKDQIWAAGSQYGAAATAYFEGGKWISQIHPKLSWSIDYRSVYEDRDGNLWFGATIDIDVASKQIGGALCLKDPMINKENFIHYPTEQKEPGAYGITQSVDGTLWMAGVSASYLENGKWLNAKDPEVLTYHSDYICNDRHGVLWVASRNYGVLSYADGKWKNYTIEDGLESNSVTYIFPESDSCLWVATDKGISKYDGQSWTNNILPLKLNVSAEGGSIRKSAGGVIWINKSSREWNRRVHKKFNRMSIKDFWTVFYKHDTRPPLAKITIYDKQVYQPGNTIISWEGIDPWSITPAEKLQFSYRMDNKPWSPFLYKTNNIFLEVPIGNHSFKVRARDLDYNISDQEEVVYFNVAPPFYWHPAFYIPIIILVIIIVILQIRIIIRGKKLRMAKRETDNILQNVEEGLALINSDYKLGSQYSLILENILEEKELAKKNILDILKNKIEGDLINTVKEYLEIMFGGEYDQKMMDDLNPLTEAKFNFGKGSAPKYLAFKFRKIYSPDGKHEELIVTIRDITSETILEQKLKESQEQAKKQMDWLVSILHVDPPLLKEFLTSSGKEIKSVECMISDVSTIKNPKDTMEKIYRTMHLIKGNASLLSLDNFAKQAHEFENKISELQKREDLKIADLNILNNGVGEIKKTLDEVNGLLERISEIHQQMRPKRSYELKIMIQAFKNLVKTLSEKTGKKVNLKHDHFQLEVVPHKDQLFIKDILVQLIRNSVSHGVESVKERKEKNKPASATIEISSLSKNNHYILKVRDDGRGIPLKKLREKAQASGKWTEKEINSWHSEKLKNLIFEHGISTADNVDMNSGRGVGMDLVKEKIQSRNGKIKVNTKEGEYTEFEITIPLS